jgi:protoporphyrinogen oxidase
MNYDYIIIGGGPTGLTLAWCLSKYNKKVALVDKNDSLGGCHRVKRINGLFTEHGPRVYFPDKLFLQILQEMDIDFYKLFTKYKIKFSELFKQINNNLSIKELSIISYRFLLINEKDKNITTLEFMKNYNFSNRAIAFINSLCRLVSGINADNYLLYNFLFTINFFILDVGYQPLLPNDIGLFNLWKNALIKNNVDIFLNNEVTDLNNSNNKIISILCNNNFELKGNNFIFAIPPYNISLILNKSNNIFIKNAFGNLDNFSKWSNNSNYITFIPIIFHWNKKLNLDKIWGFPSSKTSWELIFIILSDYIIFNDERSQTVISVSISNNNRSNYTNKTPNEIKIKDDLINETFRQLKLIFPNLPNPSYVLLEQNYHDGEKWISNDTAFACSKYGFIKNNSNIFINLYNCGTQNNINANETNITSAVASAIELLHKLIDNSNNDYKIKNSLTIHKILLYILIIIIIIYLIKINYKKKV